MNQKEFAALFPSILVVGFLFSGGLVLGLIQALGWLPGAGFAKISLIHFKHVFTDPDFFSSLFLTFYISSVSTFAAASLAVLMAISLLHMETRAGIIRVILQVPLLAPHLMVGITMIFLLSPTGFFSRLFHAAGITKGPAGFPVLVNDPFAAGIMVSYIWKEIPFIGFMVYAALKNGGEELLEAGKTLGAGKWSGFRYILFPFISKPLFSACAIVFAYTFGAFEIPFLLGRTYPMTLPVLAYRRYSDIDLLSRPEGIATGLVIAFFAGIFGMLFSMYITGNSPDLKFLRRLPGPGRLFSFFASLFSERTRAVITEQAVRAKTVFHGKCFQKPSWLVCLKNSNQSIPGVSSMYLVILALSVVLPFAPLVLWSFSKTWFYPRLFPEWGLRAWEYVFQTANTQILDAVLTSICVSFSASLLAVLLGLPAARVLATGSFSGKGFICLLLMLPIAVPPLSVAMGLHLWFIRLGLADSFAGVVLLHLAFCLPYAVFVLMGVFSNYNPDFEAQAKTLGASASRVFIRVTIPLIFPGILVAFLFSFLLSWTQYLSTLIIGGGKLVTLPILLFSLMGSGDRPVAALVCLIFVFPALFLLLASSRGLSEKNLTGIW